MRTLTLALLFFTQAQTYPPPYPRAGTTKIMENNRVEVWDVTWLKQAYPMHRHIYDYQGVDYTSGDRIIVSEQGVRSPTAPSRGIPSSYAGGLRTARKARASSRFAGCS